MEQEHLKKVLLSILFTASRPLKVKDFIKTLELDEGQIKTALDGLLEEQKNDGIVLLCSQNEYQLATNSENSTQVKNFLNAELREKLTDATVEVLAIIGYRQPISKAEIEAIRGVNSQYSIRHLLMRGMIEKVSNPGDARSVLYQTTTEFLMHMGLNSVNDLPDFAKLVENIKLPETPALKDPSQISEENIAPVEPSEPSETPESETPIEQIEEILEIKTEAMPQVEVSAEQEVSEDSDEEDEEDIDDEDDEDEE